MTQSYLLEIQAMFSENKISSAEFTAYCLLPNLTQAPLRFQSLHLKEFSSKKFDSFILNWLRTYSWKGHSDRVRRTLLHWHLGNYPLVQSDQIPTPLELLKLQASGKRVITVFGRIEEWETLHHGKSAWDFTVHDLMHASHFFENSEWREGQVEFYNFILRNWEHPLVETLREDFVQPFEYLISDMNSHPAHMQKTFEALCLQAFKKRCGMEQSQRLDVEQENLFYKQVPRNFLNF